MKLLKNNIIEFVIWIAYLVGIIFIPLGRFFIYIYTIGLIIIRILTNTHKIFYQSNVYSENLKKAEYYLRTIYFSSFALMGTLIQDNKSNSTICYICANIFLLTGICIVICELLYLLQRKLENNESKKILEEQTKFEEKYDKIIFLGDVYTVTNLKDRALIRKLAYIISNFGIGSYDSDFDSIQDMIKILKKENYIIEETINMDRGNVDILCYSMNKLLENSKIDLKIIPEMIYKLDSEKIVNRRKESITTIVNDINVINSYLKDFNCRVIVFENEAIYYFALLNEEQICNLNELCD